MSEIIEKPYVLHVAEVIYLEICQIKKNANINNVEAVERFIGSDKYKNISSGKFHDEWFADIKKTILSTKRQEKKSLLKLLDF